MLFKLFRGAAKGCETQMPNALCLPERPRCWFSPKCESQTDPRCGPPALRVQMLFRDRLLGIQSVRPALQRLKYALYSLGGGQTLYLPAC